MKGKEFSTEVAEGTRPGSMHDGSSPGGAPEYVVHEAVETKFKMQQKIQTFGDSQSMGCSPRKAPHSL